MLADELPRWNEAQLRQLANERCRRVRDDTPEDTARLGFRADRHGRGKYINGWLPTDEAAAVEAALERRAGQTGPEPDTKLRNSGGDETGPGYPCGQPLRGGRSTLTGNSHTGVIGFDFGGRDEGSEPWSPDPR